MTKVIEDLKAHARILHRRAAVHDPEALGRVRTLEELRGLDDEALAAALKRRHCLAVVARELGFAGWPHAVSVIGGEEAADVGTLLYPPGGDAFTNIWSADYDEARAIREANGGYLLAYRRHFFVVDRGFVEMLGLDPGDPDWERIGYDWARPRDTDARARLYEKLIRRRA